MNVFYKLIKIFNKEIEKSVIEFSKMELWNLIGYKKEYYNSEQIRQVIKQLTKSNTYEISSNNKISGSIFVVEEFENTIKIEIPSTFKKYIFTQKDIDLIVKAKHNKKMDIKELDYWDTTLKTKKKSLVLLKEADIYKISGKYAKRLYTLLAQNTLSKDFKIELSIFRAILEIPSSYKMSDIDKRVLVPAITEIEAKTDIKVSKIEKIKKGRNISGLIFNFIVLKNKQEEQENNIENIKDNQQQIENKEIIKETEKSEVEILKEKVAARLIKIKNTKLLGEISNLNELEEVEYFIKNYNLKID